MVCNLWWEGKGSCVKFVLHNAVLPEQQQRTNEKQTNIDTKIMMHCLLPSVSNFWTGVALTGGPNLDFANQDLRSANSLSPLDGWKGTPWHTVSATILNRPKESKSKPTATVPDCTMGQPPSTFKLSSTNWTCWIRVAQNGRNLCILLVRIGYPRSGLRLPIFTFLPLGNAFERGVDTRPLLTRSSQYSPTNS